MCGIAGILRFDGPPPTRDEIERMTAAVAHRGPDGSGVHLEGPLALGHRRLSIIDLEGGAQPMALDAECLVVTYNGEIYNYRALRAELEAEGRVFTTQSDTEVILHAYAVWGPACVERFRGMFAFAVADHRAKRIFLARDPLGIKPLCIRRGKGYVAFASELPALRAVDDAPPTGSLRAVEAFLRFQYVPTPMTIYEEVEKLPPATWTTIEFDGRMATPTRYWDLTFEAAARPPNDAPTWEDAAADVIRDSVSAHLVADVPFGVFLSGGTDSTLVAAAMSRLLDRPVRAFSIGFEEGAYSELAYAETAAKTLGIDLTTEIVREDALDMLPWLVHQYGEPFGDSSAIPTWHVSRLARSEVPMVLSGDGGDEGFGGYGTYERWMGWFRWAQVARRLPRDVRGAWRTVRRHLRDWVKGRKRLTSAQWQQRILYVRAAARTALWRPEHRGLVGVPNALFEDAAARAPKHDHLGYAQYTDVQTYLPSDILTKVDIASMSHGLEVRPPLVDKHVMAFGATLPLSERLGVDARGRPVGKAILKRVLGKTFGEDFVHRPKAGFAIPRDRWFLPDRRGRVMLEERIEVKDGRLAELFEPAAMRDLLRSHGPEHDTSDALWLLLVLGLWMEANPEVSFA